MTLAPLTTADGVIQFHVICAITALLLGPYALYGRRKNRAHKIAGYVWVVAMVSVAVSSFFISGFAIFWGFSPIHLLAVFTLWSIFLAMRHVFAGRVAAHALVMRNLYWYGIVIAGLFNFLPGRAVNRMLFNDARELGYLVIVGGITFLIASHFRNRTTATLPRSGFRT